MGIYLKLKYLSYYIIPWVKMEREKLFLEIDKANKRGKESLHLTDDEGHEIDVKIPHIDSNLCEQAL